MWSQGMMFGIEMAAWGAAALGEIDQVGQRLRGHEGDNERWWSEWNATAERIEFFGDAEETRGHRLTSGAYYLRAAIYYFCGERFIAPSERKRDAYRSCLRCFRKGVERRYPQMERVEVPYQGMTLPAWLLKSDVSGRAPTVVTPSITTSHGCCAGGSSKPAAASFRRRVFSCRGCSGCPTWMLA